MEIAPVSRQTNGLRGFGAAMCQLLLLIALGYATTYIVRFALNL